VDKRICYLGDGALDGPARYLAGIMQHYGLPFDHIADDCPPGQAFAGRDYGLCVISDYPSANFTRDQMEHVAARVRRGAGLVMLGGWRSFHGQAGEYHLTPLAEVLPVEMQSSDDRFNSAYPCVMNKIGAHPIVDGLPFDRPSSVGGFNRLRARDEAAVVLTAIQFTSERVDGEFRFLRGEEAPLLVVGSHGEGRTAAFATDVAPHWVGGFVDWGDERVIENVGGRTIDVGNWFARFFANLLIWTGRLGVAPAGR
jgi:hypothetical protein